MKRGWSACRDLCSGMKISHMNGPASLPGFKNLKRACVERTRNQFSRNFQVNISMSNFILLGGVKTAIWTQEIYYDCAKRLKKIASSPRPNHLQPHPQSLNGCWQLLRTFENKFGKQKWTRSRPCFIMSFSINGQWRNGP